MVGVTTGGGDIETRMPRDFDPYARRMANDGSPTDGDAMVWRGEGGGGWGGGGAFARTRVNNTKKIYKTIINVKMLIKSVISL